MDLDLTVIMTVIGTAVAIIGSNIALISWLRADVKSFETEIREWKDEINREMKDFHGRLCALNERNNPKTDP